MKKFTRVLQVLMILLLSGSVLYAQNLSNEFNNAKSEKEKSLELLQKKQFVKEKVSTGIQTSNVASKSAAPMKAEKSQLIKENKVILGHTSNKNQITPQTNAQYYGSTFASVVSNGGSSPNQTDAVTIQYDDGINFNAIGCSGGCDFAVAAYFPAATMAAYVGLEMTEMTFYINGLPSTCIMNVYGPGTATTPGAVLHTQTVTPVIGWNTFTLNVPVYIDGTDLWFGYDVTDPVGVYPAGTDVGPGVAGFGDWIALAGGAWEGIVGFGLDYNWNLAATLDDLTVYANDVGVSAITSPVNGGPGVAQDVTIEVTNYGTATQSSIPVEYTFDGGTFTGTVPDILLQGESAVYTFGTQITPATNGVYTLQACTVLPADESTINDCLSVNITICLFECPPGATPEGEGIIPDDSNDITNGGCNSDPNVFGMVSCGETVCGSTGFYVTDGSTYRDTDWYILDLSSYAFPQNVTVEFGAGYSMLGGIVSGPCATAAFIDSYVTAPCEVATVTATGLSQTGEYWIWMGADFTGGDADWSDYSFTVTCEDAPPPPVNDDMCGAIPIIVDAPPISGDNSYSTVETAWPEAAGSCWLTAASNTIWYSFVAPATGAVQINTDFVTPNDDTQLTLYDLTFGDCTNPSLTQLGCGEDDGATGYGYMAIIDVDGLTPGITYYIQVDGYSTVVGIFDIEVTTQTPCEVVCPPGSLDEAEGIIPDDTFDVTNGGCNSTPEVFGYINCGETMCGTGGFYLSGANTLRDTDWYELDLTGASVPQTVTVVFEAEYDIQGYVFAAPCPVTTSLADYLAGPCEIGTMVAPGLAAGIYYIYMSPDFGGSANWENYYFTVTCEDAAVGPCENSTQYGSATVDPAGALTTISTCNYASEYSPVDGIVLGETYEFTMEDLGTGTWITLRDAAPPGNVLASGPSPLQWTATYSGTVYPHWNLNGYCATDASCHDTWVQCLTCVSYDLDGTVNYFGDTYPMDVITVTLDDGNKTIVATTMTDGSGFYQFTGLAPGAYTLGASTDKPRGGTGLADYGLIISHLLGTQLVGLPYLSADVDNSGDIGLADYGLIVSALLGNYAFLNPDWIYGENLAVVVPTDQTFDFHAICSGDPDGSYIVPPFVPCSVTCPPGSTDEGEGVILDDSFDVTNGGCNSDPNVFGSVVCGETICGSTGFYVTDGSTYRDTDWFVLDLSAYASPQNVTIVFEAGYSVLGGIASGPCASAAFITSYVAGPCEVATLTATNLAQTGEYWIWMGADFTGNDADWSDYYVTVTCEDAAPVIGCEHSSLYPSGTITADATGLVTTISTCNYAGEYSVITGLVIGKTYEIIMSDVGTGAYISVRDGVPPAAPLLEGVSSQFWQATHTDITIHWSLDAACTSDASCHTTTIQCTDCP